MWFGIAETFGSPMSVRAENQPFSLWSRFHNSHFWLQNLPQVFPEQVEKPEKPKRHLLNPTGIPSPWDAHSKPFWFDNEWIKPWLPLSYHWAFLVLLAGTQTRNSDPRDLGAGIGTMVGTTQLILTEVLILVFILFLKTLPSFVSSLHPRGFIPKPPKPRCPGGIYHSGAGISLLKHGFKQRILGRRRNFCPPRHISAHRNEGDVPGEI